MFDIYPKLVAHGVRKGLADRLDILIEMLLPHCDFFMYNECRCSNPKTAKRLFDCTKELFKTLLTPECQEIMHLDEENYLFYLNIREIIPKVEQILECDQTGDWMGAREKARECSEWIEKLQD